jgi:putative DNA primase/helicase
MIDTDRKKHLKQAGNRIPQVAARLRAIDGVSVKIDALDQHPDLLNVENGTLDLRTGELGPHIRDHLITKYVAIKYDLAARSPTWEQFLARVQPREEVRAFLQRVVGYALTGHTKEQIVIIFWGLGANGKSVFVDTCHELIGPYGQRAPLDTIAAVRATAIPNDIARLQGARFVSISEVPEQLTLSEARIVILTGDRRIVARFMRGEWFDVDLQATFILVSNYKPVLKVSNEAMRRRVIFVPFDVTIPEGERDQKLLTKLKGELPGILAWAVEGARQWYEGGLAVPDSIRHATDAYLHERDVLGRFIAEECVSDPTAITSTVLLHTRFAQWCVENGETDAQGNPRLAMNQFVTGLEQRGFERHSKRVMLPVGCGETKRAVGVNGLALREVEHEQTAF